MNLLIDFGNTRLKWAPWIGGRLAEGGVFAHAEATLPAMLEREWAGLPQPERVLVASVVKPELEQALEGVVASLFARPTQFVRSPVNALGIVNAYAEHVRLGVDRFLALAALHAKAARGQILVSCGTALTLDALCADGRHLGGLIAPSPQLMREALGRSTARTGGARGMLTEIADNTADAVHSGSVLAAVALVERFRRGVERSLGSPIAMIGDGGGIDELLPLLPDLQRERDLVLRGLALWAEHARA